MLGAVHFICYEHRLHESHKAHILRLAFMNWCAFFSTKKCQQIKCVSTFHWNQSVVASCHFCSQYSQTYKIFATSVDICLRVDLIIQCGRNVYHFYYAICQMLLSKRNEEKEGKTIPTYSFAWVEFIERKKSMTSILCNRTYVENM